MKLSEYQIDCERTIPMHTSSDDDEMFLGLFSEGGELINLFKKMLYQGHDIPPEKFIEEMGDCAFYVTANCAIYRIGLEAAYKLGVSFFQFPKDQTFIEAFPLKTLCRMYFKVCNSIDEVRYSDPVPDDWQMQLAMRFGALMRIIEGMGEHFGIKLVMVIEANVAKRLKRYPEGYSDEASRNRTD